MKSLATFTWAELLEVSGGESVSHHRAFESAPIETDTRTLEPGSFFLPLSGENFDGNTYIEKAYDLGAAGSFVSTGFLQVHPELKRFPNLIAVPEPLMTYLALGRFHRRRVSARVVAITGSSGKTTTKEMLFAMLTSALEDRVQKSEKNFNNEVGVAITLLNLKPETEVLIVEMGMRGLNQINLLSIHAEPDVAMVTNIGPAHIGLLGSLESIARAKSEIFEGLNPKHGLGIINGDDALLVRIAPQFWIGCLNSFSLHEVENIHTRGEQGVSFEYEDVVFEVGLPGTHNVMNALACIKACEALNIPLKKVAGSLAQFQAGGGRWQKSQLEGGDNLWIINDAYNANPSSMRVALGSFLDTPFPGLRKIAILGEMAELGEFSEQYHREIGEWLNTKNGLDALIVVGEGAYPLADAIKPETAQVAKFASAPEAGEYVKANWPNNAILFLKASRAARLEDIPNQLTEGSTTYATP